MNNIGLAFKEWLQENGISQQEVADQLGVTLQYINGICNGRKPIGKKNAKLLSEKFGISESFLLTGVGEICKTETDKEIDYHPIDHSSLVNALLASKDETIEALKRELAKSDKLINTLQQQNADLRSRIYEYEQESILKKHPFGLGVSDQTDKEHSQL